MRKILLALLTVVVVIILIALGRYFTVSAGWARRGMIDNRPLLKNSVQIDHFEAPNLVVTSTGDRLPLKGFVFNEHISDATPKSLQEFFGHRDPIRISADSTQPSGVAAELRIEYWCGNSFHQSFWPKPPLPRYRIADLGQALAFLGLGELIITRKAKQAVPPNEPTDKTASKHDVGFVLNWCNLSDDRIEEVIHSYASARSFLGGHLNGHAIRISHVDPSELVHDDGRGGGGWYRGDALSGTAEQAIDFAKSWLGSSEMPWFPTIDEIRSAKMFIHVWSVDMAGTRPNAAQIIFVRPEDRMVFYFDAKL